MNDIQTFIKNKFSKTLIKLRKIKKPKFNFLKSIDSTHLKYNKVPKKTKKIFIKMIFILLVIYLIIGSLLSLTIYKYRINNKTTKALLSIYPLPAGYVGGRIIFVKPVFLQISYIKQFSTQTGQKIESDEIILNKVVDQQIEIRLVEHELGIQKLSISKKDIDQAFKNINDSNGGVEEVDKVLKSLYGMTERQFKSLIGDQLKKDKLQEQGVERVKARHILVADENQAKNIIKDINENKKSFEDSAKEFSKDVNSREKGGELGNIARGSMPANFDEVAFDKAEVGKLYPEPIKTDFGWHIIKIDSKSGKIKQSFDAWLADAKKNAKIIKFLK